MAPFFRVMGAYIVRVDYTCVDFMIQEPGPAKEFQAFFERALFHVDGNSGGIPFYYSVLSRYLCRICSLVSNFIFILMFFHVV